MDRLSYRFKDVALLQKALTHRSFAVENGHMIGVDNERLEFLGDAVLDLVVSDLLWRSYPDEQEGPLSHRRAALVSEGTLAIVAHELDLSELLILGKGERQSGGATKPRLIASALEALIGAVYLDSNYETVFRVIAQLFHQRVKEQGGEAEYRRDFKTRLQEVVQKDLLQTPTYVLEEESGPPHDRRFKVSVRFGAQAIAFGEGKSKKQAEQNAAEIALGSFGRDSSNSTVNGQENK
jgi:ribonuclease-3